MCFAGLQPSGATQWEFPALHARAPVRTEDNAQTKTGTELRPFALILILFPCFRFRKYSPLAYVSWFNDGWSCDLIIVRLQRSPVFKCLPQGTHSTGEKKGKWPKKIPLRKNTGNLEILPKHREFPLLKLLIP